MEAELVKLSHNCAGELLGGPEWGIYKFEVMEH